VKELEAVLPEAEARGWHVTRDKGSLADGWVIVAMVVTADDPAEAIRKTVATVRAAIQKIGDATPGWERITDLAPLAVRPADSEPIHA